MRNNHVLYKKGDWVSYLVQKTVCDVLVRENVGLTVLKSDTRSGKTEVTLAR
jgi:hypothetical protein